MKKITCKELGGACDLVFVAKTFEEIMKQSREHGIEMAQKEDKAHLEAMEKMKILMKSSEAVNSWVASKKEFFDALPDIE